MPKPFKTIDEQVKLLESRGLAVDDDTARVLLREGYYSVVNGYKEPFIDREATLDAGDDRFSKGTAFSDVYALFEFDRELRDLTFRQLIRAEATMRTAVSYCFSEAHRGPEDYLLQSSFCTRDEFAASGKRSADYARELSGLTGILGDRARSSHTDFVAHYRDVHGFVPLWVLCNDLTFGNVEHFFNLMKPTEKAAVCRAISESTGRLGDRRLGYFDARKAVVSAEVMVKLRNICAHDERLYCARVGGRKDVSYGKAVWMLERYLTADEFDGYLRELHGLLASRLGDGAATGHALRSIGFEELAEAISERTE